MPDAQPQPPVVFVPGITATGLDDFYPIPPEEVWSAVLKKNYERISMHPDDTRYEALEPARLQPRGIFGLIYGDLVDALRHDLSPRRAEATPVFAFSYDWRQDCRRTAELLAEFVQEVIDRSLLLPHYRAAGKSLRVDLVGHSMGGLVIADYLTRFGKDKKVRRVVSIGAPFEGAVDAVEKISTGMGTLTGNFPRDRDRESSRTIPALYQLLPSYAGVVEGKPGQSTDLFEVATWKTWQRSVLMTLKEYIRLHQAVIEPDTLLEQYLSAAWKHRKSVRALRLADALPEKEKGWLAIVGLGAQTRVCIEARKEAGEERWFTFPDRVDAWTEDHTSRLTGDGTVPFSGAVPRFLAVENLACVSPEEFGPWELQDRVLAKVAGFHATLPTVNLVQRITTKFLRPAFSGDVRARPAPGVSTPDWPMKMDPI